MSVGPDTRVRKFFAGLGITLLPSRSNEAPARCFAASGTHRRGDRTPSTSVNVSTGAWLCHGCGARGGPYDAALLRGHSPRSAMELLAATGLVDRRQHGRRSTTAPQPDHQRPNAMRPDTRRLFTTTEDQVARWVEALNRSRQVLERLKAQRGISPSVLERFQIGTDGSRITIPTRNAQGQLVGVLRWSPFHHGTVPKMLAVPGSRRELFPPPEHLPAPTLVLCEGEPDALAAHTAGIQAVAIPGAGGWRSAWASRFADRRVLVTLDCDNEGRNAARLIARDLTRTAAELTVVDLDPDRDDGYDLTNHLLADRRHPLVEPAPRIAPPADP